MSQVWLNFQYNFRYHFRYSRYTQVLLPALGNPVHTPKCNAVMCSLQHTCAMHFRYSKYTPAPDSPPFRCTLCHTPMCNAPMCSLPAPMCYALECPRKHHLG